MKEKWLQFAEALQTVGLLLRLDWECEFPPFDSLPSPKLEKEIDAWSSRLAGNLMGSLKPPKRVRPWLLARLAVATVECRAEASESTPAPLDQVTPDVVRRVLIDEWHRQLKQRWNLMVLDDLS